MVRVIKNRLVPEKLHAVLQSSDSGSLVYHYARVKAKGKLAQETSHIEFSAAGDVEAELEEIEAEIRRLFPVEDVILIRRLGRLTVGDIISLVAASAPGSDAAFDACRHGIELLKKMKTMAKREVAVKAA